MSDGNHNPPAVAASGLAGLVERLRLRTLVQHGGPKGMSYGWNLTEGDSELHRDAAEQLTRLAGERQVLAQWISDALAVLETIDAEDEDEGLGLELLEDAGQALVAAVLGLNGQPVQSVRNKEC